MRKAFLAAFVSALLVYVPVAPAASPIAVGQGTVKGTAEGERLDGSWPIHSFFR
jgi:hypothetical protein